MERYLFSLIGEPNHYDRWDNASEEQKEVVFAHYRDFTAAVRAQGGLVAGEALDRPSIGFTIVRGVGGRRPEPGGFGTAVERLCGFYLADLPDEDCARSVAALLPPGYSVEVRLCPDVGVTPR